MRNVAKVLSRFHRHSRRVLRSGFMRRLLLRPSIISVLKDGGPQMSSLISGRTVRTSLVTLPVRPNLFSWPKLPSWPVKHEIYLHHTVHPDYTPFPPPSDSLSTPWTSGVLVGVQWRRVLRSNKSTHSRPPWPPHRLNGQGGSIQGHQTAMIRATGW